MPNMELTPARGGCCPVAGWAADGEAAGCCRAGWAVAGVEAVGAYDTCGGSGGHGLRVAAGAIGCSRKLLEINHVARLFRAGLDGCGRQTQLMLEGAGDAVQLPDEFFEVFRAG